MAPEVHLKDRSLPVVNGTEAESSSNVLPEGLPSKLDHIIFLVSQSLLYFLSIRSEIV